CVRACRPRRRHRRQLGRAYDPSAPGAAPGRGLVGAALTRPEGRPPRPVLMIVHAYYEEDPRVRRQAESLVAAGRPVLVLSLRRPELPAEDVLEGVHVRRLDEQRHQGAGLGPYLGEAGAFLLPLAVAQR